MPKQCIILNNNHRFVYTTNYRDVTNPLGVIVASLMEYSIYQLTENGEEVFCCKVCKTKEGNWWSDGDEVNRAVTKLLLPHLKAEIDKCEDSVNKTAKDCQHHDSLGNC